jgi:uncharacterized protein YigE (DUF2233 family)
MEIMSLSENNANNTPTRKTNTPEAPAPSSKSRIGMLVLLGMIFLGAEWYILEKMFEDSNTAKPKQVAVDPKKEGVLKTPQPIEQMPLAQTVLYNNAEYDVFVVPMHKNKVKLYWNDDQGFPLRNFQALKDFLENSNQQLVFAMNAGMYAPPPQNAPVGLYVEAGTTLMPLVRRDTGYGNFYMQPNGVFALNDTAAVVCEKNAYESLPMRVTYATQSGPMLVINGQLHPAFKPASTSLYIRNGVGVTADKKIVFAISNVPVNFYDFAMLFKEKFDCTNALYLDGAISKMYLPQGNRLQVDGELGPMIAIPQPLKK